MRKAMKKIGIMLIINILVPINVLAMMNEIENRAINDILYNPKYEFRAAWIATVYNLDWPSQEGLGVKDQKEEYMRLLDNLKGAGINAVIVQIRPSGDALYPSKYAPWSEYLTGVQGKYPGYNPLRFMIEEAHKRGMEFHAWMNPFRITTSGLDKEKLAENNIAFLRPDWLIAYDNKWMLNPGLPEVREHIVDIVTEIISEYPVDGIHFDDYFYPYLNLKEGGFPDDKAYADYGKGYLSRDQWRRDNINQLICEISKSIKLNNPKVKFGISPFGIWANKRSNKFGSTTQAGVSSYETLYADTRYWVQQGWIDYIVPQLYWKFDYERAPYHVLVDWWSKELQDKNTHLYIGQAAYKVKEDENWTAREVMNQLTFNRTKEVIKGSVFFSARDLQENVGGLRTKIKNNMYDTKALIPPMPWLPGKLPNQPKQVRVKEKDKYVKLNWIDDTPENTDYYVIYKFEKGVDNIDDPGNILEVIKNEDIKSTKKEFVGYLGHNGKTAYRITAVSNSKGESIPSEVIKIK